jgi:type VI protein secretion system component Hcp
MEKTMSKSTAINTAATSERELTEDDLALVSGGKGDAPVKYMEYKLKEVLISGVTLSS